MPPDITALGPLNFATGTLQDETVLDERALGQSCIDNRLGRDRLAATLALVGSDDDTRFGVLYAIAERLCRETSENDRVDGTETCASQESNGSFRDPV